MIQAILIAFAIATFAFSPDAKADQSWKGTIKIWTADLCGSSVKPNAQSVDASGNGAIAKEANCSPVPKPVGAEWAVDLPVKEITEPGYHVVSRTTFAQAPWNVTILVTRTNPTNGIPSFLAVQTTLKHDSVGIVAQCARYDALGAFSFLPPGSCSGQMSGKLVGISLLSPLAVSAP